MLGPEKVPVEDTEEIKNTKKGKKNKAFKIESQFWRSFSRYKWSRDVFGDTRDWSVVGRYAKQRDMDKAFEVFKRKNSIYAPYAMRKVNGIGYVMETWYPRYYGHPTHGIWNFRKDYGISSKELEKNEDMYEWKLSEHENLDVLWPHIDGEPLEYRERSA